MDYIVKNFKESPLTWIIQIVAVIVVIANLYLASKLAPVTQNLDNLATRVEANDRDISELSPLSTDVAVIKSNLETMKDDIKDIKSFLNVR